VVVAGDEAVVCANEGAAINVANRIVISGMDIFMARILPVPGDRWQVTSLKIGKRKCSHDQAFRMRFRR
jgi:hypothetical protein